MFMFRANPKGEAFPEIRGLGARDSSGVQHQHTGNLCHCWGFTDPKAHVKLYL